MRDDLRLIGIVGNLWELSQLQRTYKDVEGRPIPHETAWRRVLQNKDISDIARVLKGYGVRSEAKAIIELRDGLPQQLEYEIYLNTKGFYANVRGERVFLLDIMEE